ncbi:phosphocholine cytidylyltransferase family protein [Bacteroides sp. OttesenSCG-928-D19]|nr:phosphocholine cytidylyltransferase family protein [Bacteroides sp. OttesenSCG-928-N06]MDL2305284.1 phosphocholine cytidylyltransferase family protein [Bacteroides sp. OttesenSCG-928-D19]
MQAIILAAGMGSRLEDLTRNKVKCMIQVNGISLIERVLHQLDTLNLKRIILVVGYEARQLCDYVSGLNLQTPVVFIENPIYDKTNNIYSLALAQKELQEDDTLLVESDLILEDHIFDKLIQDPRPDIALIAKHQSWMDGTVVNIDCEDNILRFIDKKSFNAADVDSYYKTVNIYKFSRMFLTSVYVPLLEEFMEEYGLNEYYEQVLKCAVEKDKSCLKALRLNGEKWYEIDNARDLSVARELFP